MKRRSNLKQSDLCGAAHLMLSTRECGKVMFEFDVVTTYNSMSKNNGYETTISNNNHFFLHKRFQDSHLISMIRNI